MIAGDIHTHVWSPEHLSAEFLGDLIRAWPDAAAGLDAGYEAHAGHAAGARRSVVLAFDAQYSGFNVPDEFVAEYVARDPDRLVGFCSVDAARADAVARVERGVNALGLRGLKLAPTYQGFDPLSAEAFALYEAAEELDLPILIHQGITFVRRSLMKYALPIQIDEVALRHPKLRIVIAHMGHPWISECIAVVRKHPNVYADVSALTPRPHQFRSALIEAAEYGCAGKLLFGTDWPFGTIDGHVRLLEQWRDDDDAPEPLRAAAAAVLVTDPLAVLGL